MKVEKRITPPPRIVALVIGLSLIASYFSIPAAAQSGAAPEADTGVVVCEPGEGAHISDCAAAGPSVSLKEIEAQGIPYPESLLPIYSPDSTLTSVPYLYFKVDRTGTALYPSLEAAIAGAGSGRVITPGFLFVSYLNRVDTGQGVYYMLGSGEWIAGEGSRISYSPFQGIQLNRTPRSGFGWVLGETSVRRQPSYDLDHLTNETYYRFNIVPVYATQTINGTEWVLIGPNKWIEGRLIAVVTPKPAPPEGVTAARWIEVNLAEQTLVVYDNYQMVFATIISSGVDPYWTQPGLFQIYKKKDKETMSGAFEADRSDYYYVEDVPYTMYFDKARALHGAYWHTFFGYTQSHGCVNLSIGDSHWLYDWANEGDWVWVHDPSGLTPTDPDEYGDGGA